MPESGGVGRWVGVDAARAVAIAGMVLMHTVGSMFPRPGENRVLSGLVAFFHGRAAITFVLLAGVGVGLQVRRRRAGGHPRWAGGVRASLVCRALLVMAVGAAMLADPDNPVYVIVHVYGVYFLVAALVLRWSPRRLVTVGSALLVVWPLVLALRTGIIGWAVSIDDTMPAPLPRPSTLLVTGAYPVLPWVGVLFLGMAAAHLDLRHRRVAARLAAAGLAAVVVLHGSVAVARVVVHDEGWLTSIGVGSAPPSPGSPSPGEIDPRLADAEIQARLAGRPPSWGWSLITTEGHTSSPSSFAACVAFALATLGLASLVASVGVRPVAAATGVVASLGRLALTVYVAHVFVIARGPLPDGTNWAATVLAALAMVAVATVLSWLWVRRFAHGPLEALVSGLAGTAETAWLAGSPAPAYAPPGSGRSWRR